MNVARNISVCLVDDQTLVRQGIRSLLELSDEIRVVAEAADGIQALDIVPKVKPDVVLLDMTHYASIDKGVIDLRDLIYFLLIIAFWLYASAVVIDLKKAD